jgi:hypothetical protein
MRRFLPVIAAFAAFSGSAFAGTIYFENFEDHAFSSIAGGHIEQVYGTVSALGSYVLEANSSNSAMVLSLTGLNPGTAYDLSFTLVTVNGWDYDSTPDSGSDRFLLTANSSQLLNIALPYSSNVATGTSTNSHVTFISGTASNYIDGSNREEDAYAITFTGLTSNSSGTLSISFAATGLNGSESFAIDNVAVAANPEPGTWMSLFGGLAAVVFFRRRK